MSGSIILRINAIRYALANVIHCYLHSIVIIAIAIINEPMFIVVIIITLWKDYMGISSLIQLYSMH